MNGSFLSGLSGEMIPDSSKNISKGFCGRTLSGMMGRKLETYVMMRLGAGLFVQ